jgi:hypothetical protein
LLHPLTVHHVVVRHGMFPGYSGDGYVDADDVKRRAVAAGNA